MIFYLGATENFADSYEVYTCVTEFAENVQ